jgi:4-amino-4-deoxy-L-arabinose transferase-like glycosyltransferase
MKNPFTKESAPHFWILLGVCLFAFFWRLGSVPLFDLDEALYVGSARQMVLSGDYITPRLNSRPPFSPETLTVPFFEKPIMVYWCSALSMRIFGISELAARLPVAVSGLAAVLLVYVMGVRWFGRRAGFFSALLYALAPMTVIDARQMTTDGLLVLWLLGMLFAFAKVEGIGEERSTSPMVYILLFWVLSAFAILTKGAVGLLLPAMIIFFFGFTGKGRGTPFLDRLKSVCGSVLRLRPVLGLLLCLLLASPWHIAIAQRGEMDAQGRTFVQEYLVRQHIGRFRGGDAVHNAPLPTYIAYFLIGFFPWACYAPSAFRRRISEEEESHHEAEASRFLLVWFAVIFGFFTLGAAKLPTYIVPAYPAAALLFGRWLNRVLESLALRGLHGGAFFAMITTLLLAAFVSVAPRFAPPHNPIPVSVLQLANHITAILALGSGGAWLCVTLGRRRAWGAVAGVSVLIGTVLVFVLFVITEGYTLLERQVQGPYQRVATAANRFPNVPVIYYNIVPRRPSMLYYATYSPHERKEPPLLPDLARGMGEEALIVTSLKSYNEKLLPELKSLTTMHFETIEREGEGRETYILVRLRRVR